MCIRDRAYIDSYLEKYSGVRAYMHDIKETAREKGYVETIFGRRRAIPEIKSSNFNVRSGAERIALNTPVQGSAADIIKLAMVRVFHAPVSYTHLIPAARRSITSPISATCAAISWRTCSRRVCATWAIPSSA